MSKYFSALALSFTLLACANGAYAQMSGTDEIDYRGVKIKLSRKYSDYDAYKNDIDKILPSELPKLEKMIADAPIGKEFNDWKSFSDEIFALKVPGFGLGGGPKVKAIGKEIIVTSVEIPTRLPEEKFRFFVLEKFKDQRLRVIDDFVSSGYPYLAEVIITNDHIAYLSKDGSVVRERKF